ncbi:carboxymuconolactone decarboxylase family protein [Pseudomonas aeruginosa]
MSRVPVLTLENAPEAARPFLQTALNNSGYIPNLLGVLANAPAALETYLTVSGLNAKASLGLPEREVVQLVAATTHGCDFCVAGHTAVARNKARLPEPVIEALRARGELPDARYEALADFTRMLDPTLSDWLDRQADALDRGDADPAALLPRLAAAGVLGVAVEERLGGAGGTLADAVERVAAVAARSLTAAFVFWGQRAFIEYLLQSPNQELRQRLLGDLLAGRLAGATGLSNAMKFLSGIEALQVVAHAEEAGWRLDGRLPWVTNLRSGDFVVAAAIERGEGGSPFVLAIPEGLAGVQRSADLRLLGLQCSNTAALDLRAVAVGRDWLLHDDARQFLPRVRPAFLGLQCGMAIGLARRALDEVQRHLGGSRSLLDGELAAQRETLDGHVAALHAGLASGEFASQPARLFRIRIGLAEAAANAVQLELQASGGKAYLSEHGAGFARRWRESAFVPIVTPSLVQLRAELQRQAEAKA